MNIKQRKILSLLVEINGRRYSELYKNFEEEDKFPYHIKQLVQKDYVNKRNNRYFLTIKGAHASEEFESNTLRDRKLSIPIYNFICKFKNKYLIRKCFGTDPTSHYLYSIPGVKSDWGCKNKELFERRLKDKLGIQGKVKYRSTCHLLSYTTKDQLMWDDLLILFDVEVEKILFERESFFWFTKEEIGQLSHRHKPLDVFIVDDSHEPYCELVIKDNFNLREEDLIDNSRLNKIFNPH